jgi:hypothetical protein
LSSDCTPHWKLDVWPALTSAFTAETSGTRSPVTLEVKSYFGAPETLADGSTKLVPACLSARLDDGLRVTPLPTLCATGTGNYSVGAARSNSERALSAKASAFREQFETEAAQIVAALQTCTFRAAEPINGLTINLGDRARGPFSGNPVEIDCLPNTTLRFKYDGHGPTEVSPDACANGVELTVGKPSTDPALPPVRVGTGSGTNTPPPRPPSDIPWLPIGLAVVAAAAVVGLAVGKARKNRRRRAMKPRASRASTNAP